MRTFRKTFMAGQVKVSDEKVRIGGSRKNGEIDVQRE